MERVPWGGRRLKEDYWIQLEFFDVFYGLEWVSEGIRPQ
jgi:hypothetical protein